jgi:hypothetical protein
VPGVGGTSSTIKGEVGVGEEIHGVDVLSADGGAS